MRKEGGPDQDAYTVFVRQQLEIFEQGGDMHKVVFWKECSSLCVQNELEERKQRPEHH